MWKQEDAGSVASAYKKTVLKGLLLITALIITSASAFAEEIRPVITQFDLSGYPKVDAYVAVLDKDGRPIKDIPLSRGKWQIKENGAVYEPMNIERVKAAGAKRTSLLCSSLTRAEA